MRDAAVALDDAEREKCDLLLDRGRLVAQYAVISFSYSLKSFASHRSCNIAAGWLPYQANRFSSTNRGVAIETREMTYLFNSRTADSFLASALCGGAIGKPNFGFPRARIRDIEPSV